MERRRKERESGGGGKTQEYDHGITIIAMIRKGRRIRIKKRVTKS